RSAETRSREAALHERRSTLDVSGAADLVSHEIVVPGGRQHRSVGVVHRASTPLSLSSLSAEDSADDRYGCPGRKAITSSHRIVSDRKLSEDGVVEELCVAACRIDKESLITGI